MKEKRSFFNMIFGKKEKNISGNDLKLMNGYSAVYTNISESIENNIIAAQCIHTIATHCAKMIPKHYQTVGELKNKITGEINYILTRKPNPYMNTYTFLYKIVSLWLSKNNVYIYQDIDEYGYLVGLYPINPLFCTLVEFQNEVWLKFQFLNGNIYYAKYDNVIHLKDFFTEHDFYGDSPNILMNSIETQTVADDGIKNAIKISSSLRGILKTSNAMLKNKDIQEMRNNFVNDLLKSISGIAGLDAKMDFKEINLEPVLLNKAQLDMVNGNIHGYFMINEKIIKSMYTSEEWNAFYESVIEPRAIQMGQAFTNGIFTEEAIKKGHCIEFSVNRIQYAKTDTKISLIKEAGSLGLLTVDEGREILDLPAIGGEEGKKRLQTLNVINANLADNYQGGKKDGKAKKEMRINELRALETQNDEMIVEGYAIVFESATDLGWCTEIIDRNALNNCDMQDCVLKYNHNSNCLILARTRNKSLELTIDNKGLRIRATLIDTTQNRDIYKSIKAGLLDKMSFAFSVKKQEWDYEKDTRRIKEISKLFDVSVVDVPAYDTTEIYARGKDEYRQEKEEHRKEKLQTEKEKAKILLSL